ncbi:MAG: hypothetical protein Q4B43_11220 [Bacteroidota bacterium]|nr:hypothetical protein [Bacteroidota bacterium]
MLDIEDKIFKEYRILYDKGYVNESVENRGSLFSSLKCVNETIGLIFYFSIEKGFLSIAITTNELLNQKVFFDFFYILKILYPQKTFEEIKLLSYDEEISINLRNIEELFSKKKIDTTLKEINMIMKKYSKIRWKMN